MGENEIFEELSNAHFNCRLFMKHNGGVEAWMKHFMNPFFWLSCNASAISYEANTFFCG